GGSLQLGARSPGRLRGDETLQGVEVSRAQGLDAAALVPQLVKSGVTEPPFAVSGPRLRRTFVGIAPHRQPSAAAGIPVIPSRPDGPRRRCRRAFTGAPRRPSLPNPRIGPAPPSP